MDIPFGAVLLRSESMTKGADDLIDWLLGGHPNAWLFTETLSGYDWGQLRRFDRSHRVSTRTRHSGPDRGDKPAVLVWAPDLKMFASVAGWVRRGGLLAIVESVDTPLTGWGRAVGAIDFTTGEVMEPLEPGLAELATRLAFYGNNGFTTGFGQDQARRLVARSYDAGVLDRSIISAVRAYGDVSGDGLQRLDKIVSQHVPKPRVKGFD